MPNRDIPGVIGTAGVTIASACLSAERTLSLRFSFELVEVASEASPAPRAMCSSAKWCIDGAGGGSWCCMRLLPRSIFSIISSSSPIEGAESELLEEEASLNSTGDDAAVGRQ